MCLAAAGAPSMTRSATTIAQNPRGSVMPALSGSHWIRDTSRSATGVIWRVVGAVGASVHAVITTMPTATERQSTDRRIGTFMIDLLLFFLSPRFGRRGLMIDSRDRARDG